MKLAQLASEPQLVKIILDDTDITEQYGEPLEFYMYDRQNMDTFVKMANIGENNVQAITEIVKELVLDENGNKILVDNVSLPTNVMLKVIEAAVSSLGNSVSQITQS